MPAPTQAKWARQPTDACPEAPICRLLSSPIALAALVTLANAAKPVTVDDTAYLLYARHIAAHPLDPYGFTIFWWAEPEPAMQILAPPVVPYWLAAGVTILGESPALLKLWMFPFLLILAWALRALLVRFSRGTEAYMLPLLMLSPAVLPAVNLMLDIPTAALGLAAVALVAVKRPDWRRAALAGLVGALAMQAKYTAFVVPVALAWYALTHRQVLAGVVAVAVCAAGFAAWEGAMFRQYGESHFLYHATRAGGEPAEGESRLSAMLEAKRVIIPPLAGHLGCAAAGVGLIAWAAVGLARRRLAAVGLAWCAGFVLVCTLPRRWTVVGGDLSAGTLFWQTAGWCWLAGLACAAAVQLFRARKGLGLRFTPSAWFLAGWLALEVGGAVALTPFPASRRVIGVTLVGGLVAARLAGRLWRTGSHGRPPQWVLAVGVGAGVAVAAIDTLDAFPEKVCAERAAELTRERPPGATIWFAGHWGFQFYCERAGMKPLVAGQTVMRAGDLVVLPVPPGGGFHRPYAGFTVHQPGEAAEVVGEVVRDDPLSARTVPSYYGGLDPVAGRDHPRLRVRVYRLREDWVMPR